jgi:hypothetical protein
MKRTITLLLLIGAAYGGYRFEATQIQGTCEAEDTPTVLNGSTYVCLTMEQAQQVRKALAERGA